MSVLFDEFENQNLVEALKLRARVFKGDKSVSIQDARAKLELACWENDKYAWYFKGRALKYGGFGYHKESWPYYEGPYANAKAFGCTWIGGKEEIQETQVPRAVFYLHKDWYLVDFYDEYNLFLDWYKNGGIAPYIFTAALNGNEQCALIVVERTTHLSDIQFCKFAITSRSYNIRYVILNPDCRYLIGKALFYDKDQKRLHDRFGLSMSESLELKDLFVSVNTNCRKSIFAWLNSGFLIKDLRIYIGKMVWDDRANDAGDWLY